MALVEGVKYGLSASDNNNNGSCSFTSGRNISTNQPNSGTSKSVIFVKLTDSALKAIEDYLRSQVSIPRWKLNFLIDQWSMITYFTPATRIFIFIQISVKTLNLYFITSDSARITRSLIFPYCWYAALVCIIVGSKNLLFLDVGYLIKVYTWSIFKIWNDFFRKYINLAYKM
jgi:hypothetical protein